MDSGIAGSTAGLEEDWESWRCMDVPLGLSGHLIEPGVRTPEAVCPQQLFVRVLYAECSEKRVTASCITVQVSDQLAHPLRSSSAIPYVPSAPTLNSVLLMALSSEVVLHLTCWLAVVLTTDRGCVVRGVYVCVCAHECTHLRVRALAQGNSVHRELFSPYLKQSLLQTVFRKALQ